MCGIYATNIPYQKRDVLEKIGGIKFRGPDNVGYSRINDITLGHLRLSILDLEERSNQPMERDGKYIVYNGEIYNFLSIKDELLKLGHHFKTTSDTEVLLVGYNQWGAEVLNKLNGMFAFAIYDTSKEMVFCARDRLGVKPFYYYWKEGKFEICSQLRPIMNSESKISEEAVSIYLDCGYVPSPFSIIEDVHKLPPGNYMEINLKKRSKELTEYWNLRPVVIREISYDNAKEKLHDLLIDAVKIRLRSDVPFGSFLSGGIDSALVSSIACKISDKPINTFTIGFEDPKYDESEIAAQFAKIMKSAHIETKCSTKEILEMLPKLIEVYDEPFADSSALPSLLLNSVTKRYATVALSGDGGDESFFGYDHFDSMRKFDNLMFIPLFIRMALSKIGWQKIFGSRGFTLKGMLQSKNSDDLSESFFVGYDSLQKVRSRKWLRHYQSFKYWSKDFLQRTADLNIKLWLENDSNVKVDRASMAYSVEIRSPFLDYRIIEFARSLPVSFRYQTGKKKKILRDILKEYIPEEIFDRPKHGFGIPIKKWIKKDLKEDIIKELNDDFLSSVPNLDIKKFKSQFDLHFAEKYDYSFNIWKLYILSKWYKEFEFIKK